MLLLALIITNLCSHCSPNGRDRDSHPGFMVALFPTFFRHLTSLGSLPPASLLLRSQDNTMPASTNSTTTIFFLFSAFSLVLIAYFIPRQRAEETNLVLYVHDYLGGRDPTGTTVAGKGGPGSSILDFGTIVVVDDLVTEGPEPDSEAVGRAQGLYVNSALDGKGLHLVFSLFFTRGPYIGSTLEVQGADLFFMKEREFGIVSGTGHFRFARGYGVMETESLDMANLRGVIKLRITVRHY